MSPNTRNIAETLLDHYESDYFKSNYSFSLFEQFGNDEYVICQRIRDIIDYNWDFSRLFKLDNKFFTPQEVKPIYDYIYENFDEFVKDFRGYYVGDLSLDSISFGEQEEQISSFFGFDMEYLKRILEKNDFHISGDYAYYVLDGGLHIDFTPINDEFVKLISNLY